MDTKTISNGLLWNDYWLRTVQLVFNRHKNYIKHLLTKPVHKSVAVVFSSKAVQYCKPLLITYKMILVLQDDLNTVEVCKVRPRS